MAPSGPLAGSDLLPIALASLFALSFLIAAGAFLGNRPAMALGILTAVGGIPLAAVIGVALDLPMPWALLLAGYNAVLAVVGLQAWRGAHRPTSHR
jgi:NaMN:DMB phosphoribosyltransferase